MQKEKFLYEFDYFRGFSIFLIVHCHIWSFIALNSPILQVLSNPKHFYRHLFSWEEFLIFGATSFFVFISGFLFHHIFYKRGFNYKKFMINKFKNVFCPYLVITGIFACINLFLKMNLSKEYIVNEIFFYNSYWYIPFIMCVFICSPLFIKFIESKTKLQIASLVITILYSTFSIRQNYNPLLSTLFWSSFYILGIFCSIHYEKIKNLNLYTKLNFPIICVLTTALVLEINNNYAHIKYAPVWNSHFSCNFIIIPKIFYLISILLFFIYIANTNKFTFLKLILKIFSKYSFSIFFMHPIFLFFMYYNQTKFKTYLNNFSLIELHLIALFVTITIFIVSIIIAYIVKKITGKYSKMFIGA